MLKKLFTVLLAFSVVTTGSSTYLPKSAEAADDTLAPRFLETPEEGVPEPGGSVYAIAATDDTIYVGGGFTKVGTEDNPILTSVGAFISATSGAAILDLSPSILLTTDEGGVAAAVTDGEGGYYIGGDFDEVGGIERNNIAHVLADGSVDTEFNPDADGGITTLTLSPDGGTLYVTGNFTNIGGQARSKIAAIDTATGLATGFAPSITATDTNAAVLSSDGSVLYIGGTFSSVGGLTRNNIAAINTSDGSANSFNPNANSTIETLALSSDDSLLYAGGSFNTIGSSTRPRLAELDTSTGLATSFNPGNGLTGFLIRSAALSSDDSTLYIGGNFTQIGGQSRNRIAAIDTATGLATAFNPSADSEVREVSLSTDGSVLYAGGLFSSIGGETRNSIAALDTSTGLATSFYPLLDGLPSVIAELTDDLVYVAYSSVEGVWGGVERNNIFAFNPTTGELLDFNPDADESVTALALSDNGSVLYTSGSFAEIGGASRGSIAAIDTATGLATAFDPSAVGSVNTMTLSTDGNLLYAGGDFTEIGGESRSSIAAIDTATGLATAFDPAADSEVLSLTLSSDGNLLYAGGEFTEIGGESRGSIAAIDTATGLATAFDPVADGRVYALALSEDDTVIYVGGSFTEIGSETRASFAALDTATGLASAFDADLTGGTIVNSFALTGDESRLYVNGGFTSAASEPKDSLTEFDIATSTFTEWAPDVFSAIDGDNCCDAAAITLTPSEDYLIVGSFGTPYLAVFAAVDDDEEVPEEEPVEEDDDDGQGGGSYSRPDISRAALYEKLRLLLIEYITRVSIRLPISSSPLESNIVTVRDLELGMEGEDVRALQQLLNRNGYIVSTSEAGAPGSESTLFELLTRAALVRFQLDNFITPAAGYFGPLTRAKMKELGWLGLWW